MMHYPECHRHSIRLPEYDYSGEGFYFVTICTRNRECLLGKIVDGEMILSKAGQIIGYFKYQTTQSVNCPNKRLWQRNYYEHIIRNQQSYNLISEYIQTNPLRWQEDTLFVE